MSTSTTSIPVTPDTAFDIFIALKAHAVHLRTAAHCILSGKWTSEIWEGKGPLYVEKARSQAALCRQIVKAHGWRKEILGRPL